MAIVGATRAPCCREWDDSPKPRRCLREAARAQPDDRAHSRQARLDLHRPGTTTTTRTSRSRGRANSSPDNGYVTVDAGARTRSALRVERHRRTVRRHRRADRRTATTKEWNDRANAVAGHAALAASYCARAAARWGRTLAAHAGSANPAPIRVVAGDGRLRVGFVSSDLRASCHGDGDHRGAGATRSLAPRGLRLRARCLRTPDRPGVASRQRSSTSIDVSALDDRRRSCARIRGDGIAIAVRSQRIHAATRVPNCSRNASAPLQVNSIGFAGTLGAPWYDYIHVDRFRRAGAVAAAMYSERLFRMPHSYYPSDTHARAVGAAAVARAACDLPEDAFVFCVLQQFVQDPAASLRCLDAHPGRGAGKRAVAARHQCRRARQPGTRSRTSWRLVRSGLIFAPRMDAVAAHRAQRRRRSVSRHRHPTARTRPRTTRCSRGCRCSRSPARPLPAAWLAASCTRSACRSW